MLRRVFRVFSHLCRFFLGLSLCFKRVFRRCCDGIQELLKGFFWYFCTLLPGVGVNFKQFCELCPGVILTKFQRVF